MNARFNNVRLVAVVGLLLVLTTANAQTAGVYRPNQPEVLLPAPVPVAPTPLAAFAAAYNKIGRPTIALLWNREFTDQLTALHVETVRVSEWSNETARRGSREQEGGAELNKFTATQSDGLRDGPAEHVAWRIRGGFVQALMDAQVKLMDRNVLMRRSTKVGKASDDSQQIEAAALGAGAKWMLEVLLTPVSHSTTDQWAVMTRLVRLSDGALLVESLSESANGPYAVDLSVSSPERFEVNPGSAGGYRPTTVAAMAPGQADMALGRNTAMAWMQASLNREALWLGR